MKYTWESSDIKPGVKFKNKKNTENSEFLIGYKYSEKLEEGVIFLLIHLSDGLVLKESTNEKDIAEHLNKYNYIPAKIEN